MNSLISGAVNSAVASASNAADAKAAAIYETYKPLIYAAAFMALTTWLFYFLPRFTVPRP